MSRLNRSYTTKQTALTVACFAEIKSSRRAGGQDSATVYFTALLFLFLSLQAL